MIALMSFYLLYGCMVQPVLNILRKCYPIRSIIHFVRLPYLFHWMWTHIQWINVELGEQTTKLDAEIWMHKTRCRNMNAQNEMPKYGRIKRDAMKWTHKTRCCNMNVQNKKLTFSIYSFISWYIPVLYLTSRYKALN